MQKKSIDQSGGANGMAAIALGYAIKANPGPVIECIDNNIYGFRVYYKCLARTCNVIYHTFKQLGDRYVTVWGLVLVCARIRLWPKKNLENFQKCLF